MATPPHADPPAVSDPVARVARLRASNYRSLSDDVVVEFGDLTALVGPNGSGKSNVLPTLAGDPQIEAGLSSFRRLENTLTFLAAETSAGTSGTYPPSRERS